MSREKLTSSAPGLKLVRKLASEGDRIFSTDRARELAPSVGLSMSYLRQALHHLARSGWLVRLRKGLYALSGAVPGITLVHEFEVAMALANPAAISHWSALHYHGLTEQAPGRIFVLTTSESSTPRRSGTGGGCSDRGVSVSGVPYQFIRTKPERFFGTENVWVAEARITMTDPERTLLDGLTMPKYCGDFAEVLHAFEAHGDRLNVGRIIEYALKLDAATAKRLGWVLTHRGVEGKQLRELEHVPVKGYRQLDPSGPRSGPCDRRWMIQQNLPGKAPP